MFIVSSQPKRATSIDQDNYYTYRIRTPIGAIFTRCSVWKRGLCFRYVIYR